MFAQKLPNFSSDGTGARGGIGKLRRIRPVHGAIWVKFHLLWNGGCGRPGTGGLAFLSVVKWRNGFGGA